MNTFICKSCGKAFTSYDFVRVIGFTQDGWTRYDVDDSCPECGSENYVEAERCEWCGEFRDPDTMQDGVCAECAEEVLDVETLRDYVLSDKEAFEAWLRVRT